MSNLGINFTAWPEMLAWPYLILQGWLPYKDIAIAHNPLMLLELSIFYKLFGVGILQLKIYTWLLILLNAGLLYFVVNHTKDDSTNKTPFGKKTGVISAILYILLVVVFEGNGLWFDLALTPYAILLYYLLVKKEYLFSGIVFVLGFLTKQTFIYLALPILIILIQNKKELFNNFKKLFIGSLIILVPFFVILQLFGILDDYYKWAIEFGIFYLPNVEGQIQLPSLNQFLFATVFFLPLLFTKDIILILFALTASLGVCPRWELFHFQPALPFIVIAFLNLISNKKINQYIKYIIVLIMLTSLVIGIKRQLGVNTRFFESDVKNVVTQVNNLNLEKRSLYVVNYWDNIYALTHTIPSKPLIPYISWYLSYNDNLDNIVTNLKTEVPEVIVIGKREKTNNNLYDFIDKYYSCTYVEKEVELCKKN